MEKNNEVGGELDVTGVDEVRFELDRRPEHVRVEFDNDDRVPCDPGSNDMLEYEVVFVCSEHECHEHRHCSHHHRHWELVIRWNVVGMRAIVWEVCG